MISTLNFSSIPSDELYTFGKNTLAICESKRTSIPAIVPFLDKSKDSLDKFQVSRERELTNPLIQLQTNEDNTRKRCYISFRNFCDSASKRNNAEAAESGAKLKAVFRKYGWTIQTNGQKSRTAIISDVVSEIENKYSAELKAIAGEAYLAELKQAEISYEDIAKKVVEEESANSEPTLTQTRPVMVGCFRALFQAISLQEMATPSDEVTALVAAINQLITSSTASVKAADTRAENAKKKAAAASTTDTTKTAE